jgi:DNA helicase-2/ATP-dependent DNA helicase PcrA
LTAFRAWAKNSFDFVLIDEFQDVNKVQVQIADILTEDHRNYMAIGDDDQCIYEWRGADVRYILDFKKRYQAQELYYFR